MQNYRRKRTVYGPYFYGHRQRGQGNRAPLPPPDFHTWYKYSREKLKSAIFRCFLLLFGLFSVAPLPLKEVQ